MSEAKLYDAVIRKHNAFPYHFNELEKCPSPVEAYNFICGDRFDLCFKLTDNVIESVHFHGFGCAVSKASTSLLTHTLEGKSRQEAVMICDQFLRLLKNELKPREKLFSDEFVSFHAVQEAPARYDCAALSWLETAKFLQAQ